MFLIICFTTIYAFVITIIYCNLFLHHLKNFHLYCHKYANYNLTSPTLSSITFKIIYGLIGWVCVSVTTNNGVIKNKTIIRTGKT